MGAAGPEVGHHVGVRVRVLGTLGVEGVDLAAVGSRKGRTLLAALAAAGGSAVPVDELAELLWNGRPPAKPADQLSVLASRLRRVLGSDRITRSDAGYALHAEWIDVVELEARSSEAAARLSVGQGGAARVAAAAALELVRGPLAADERGDWFDERRRASERWIVNARSALAHAAMATGDALGAATAAWDALGDDPYDESALRILMRANVVLGRPATALKAYADMRARLRDDLGVSPTAETEAVHDAILLGDETVAPQPEGHVLVGRDDELRQLHALFEGLRGGAASGVEIVGEAGIGKSALVRAFLDSVNDRALVIAGTCDELGRALSMQPVADGLEAHLRPLPGEVVDELLAGDVAAVAPLLGRSPIPPDERVPAGDGDAARTQVYRSLLTLIERLAAGRPAIVVVEDIHLAAASTLTWMQMALRRGSHLLIVTTRRPEAVARLVDATRIELGPLDAGSVASWIGADRAAALTERSGGNPLLLSELIAHEGDELPASIRELVAERVDALGASAATLRAAAVLGATVDLDLLAATQARATTELLDDLERAVDARLLVDDQLGLRFRHELVREALAASTSTARRVFLHGQAATLLAGREAADPMEVAWHARQGGDAELTADALVRAAAIAAGRFEHTEATRLLDEAIALRDGAAARLARARARMALWDLGGARVDAEQAIAFGGGGPAFELAGWVAYYRRDHDDALRLAEEGMVLGDPEVRASCLSLVGRARHTLGDLAGGEACLREAVTAVMVPTRTVAQVWLAALLAHRGADREALDVVDRARHGLGQVTHPFAAVHAHFARALALGHRGEVVGTLAALDELDDVVAGEGSQMRRFGSVSKNCRAWVLRNVGELDQARACNEMAAALPADDPPMAEPRYAGHLDLTEHELIVGDLAGARRRLDSIADVEDWSGSMHWRHRARYRLLRARLALAEGDPDRARAIATEVEQDCQARLVPRYQLMSALLGVRAGTLVDREAVAAMLAELDELAALEVWWLTAELAEHLDEAALWDDARRRVDTLAARAGGLGASLRAHAAGRFEPLGA